LAPISNAGFAWCRPRGAAAKAIVDQGKLNNFAEVLQGIRMQGSQMISMISINATFTFFSFSEFLFYFPLRGVKLALIKIIEIRSKGSVFISFKTIFGFTQVVCG
jgi:hypothetical protein